MFDWIWKAMLVFYGAMGFWSIVPIVVFIMLGMLAYKSIITPKEYHERVAFDQKKENQQLSQAKINRIMTMIIKGVLCVMGSTLFCISMYKILFT
jgi:hypothetical protein